MSAADMACVYVSNGDIKSPLAQALEKTTQDWFLVVGENTQPHQELFSQQIELADFDCAIWRTHNHINGVVEHFGGISCWRRTAAEAVLAGKPPRQWYMHDCYSITYHNSTAWTAWHAGFTQGVQMSLCDGQRPTIQQFRDRLQSGSLENLTIWHNIGADAEHGRWAMAGARQGTYMTVLTNWDWHQVAEPDACRALWRTVENSDPRLLSGQVGLELHAELALPVTIFETEHSAFFKRHCCRHFRNLGVMATMP